MDFGVIRSEWCHDHNNRPVVAASSLSRVCRVSVKTQLSLS